MMPFFRRSALLAIAIIMAVAFVPAHAEEAGSKGKTQALIRLLVRAGKNEEAAAAMRSLYPKGPPYGGELALEYYDVVGNTDSGWDEARNGLEKLVKAAPEDVSYQLMLAKHLSRRAETRRRSLQIFASLAKRPDIDKRKVLGEWRNALDRFEFSVTNIPLYQEYLEVDPDNTSIRDSLASVRRAEAATMPWKMRDRADAQLAAGHPDDAIATLRGAMKLDPKNAWVRFDLSRIYHKRGDVKRGRQLMEAGLTAAPGDADMLYANALYVSLLDEADNALRLLAKIPPKQRSPAMVRLVQKMDIRMQTQQAQALARDGKRAEMQAAMRHAETDADSDAELVNIVANAWIDLNDPARGVALMQSLAAQRSPSVDTRLYYAKLLNRTEQNDELAAVLDKLSTAKGLSASDKEDMSYLQASLAARRADSLRHEGKIETARSVLVAALAQDPENIDMLMALARVHDAAHEPQQAREVYRGILQRTPGYVGARLALDNVKDGEVNKAPPQQDIKTVLANTPADDINARMAIAEWYIGKGDTATARTIVEQSRNIAPDDPRVLVQAGRLAKTEGYYGEAMDDFRRANATGEIAEMERLRAKGYVATGMDYVSKTGSVPGISNLSVLETPVEMRMPLGYAGDRAFVQVDPVTASAGALDLNDHYNLRQYGKVLALAPAGISSAPVQSAKGAAIAFGYEEDGLRADVGTTPLGFPVSGVVGGVKWSHYTEVSGFSFDLSGRPVTSSLLSYAGAHDPVTGEVWGGVRSSGMGLHVSRDSGRLTGFVEPGYYWLTGINVLSNSEAALRTGFEWSFIQQEDMRLTAGLAITYWHYRENLRFYTFGHGGYYSPQKYYSLAIPLRWTGREERWSYLLQAAVSASVSYEKDMPFYPTSAALQAQAVAAGSTTPTYTGGNGHGTGFSLGGALEYQITPHLFGGARLQIDRSEYYTPNFAIFYLRYLFDAHSGAVPYPPDPVKAYSRY